jgi:hypothetical protein
MLRILVHSSLNNASNTSSEICNKGTQFLNKNIKSEDTVSCNWPRDLRRSLQPLDYWDRGFESRWGQGCSFLVLVVCCVGCGPRYRLITRSEESRPKLGCCATKKKLFSFSFFLSLTYSTYSCRRTKLLERLSTLNDTHSVQFPRTKDRPVGETSTWQHTTLTTDRHPRPRRVSNPQSQQASGHRLVY